jgi:L-alanine-DL-glutamate epimerase-like enolase superfamily enzyme
VSLTHFYLAGNVAKNVLAIRDGVVALPTAPGLGVEVDEAQVERFRLPAAAPSG